MISLPFTIICDQCGEESCQSTCLIDPMLLKVPNSATKTSSLKRFLVFEYPEEIPGKGWMTIEINSTLKLYCPTCKEKMRNDTLLDETDENKQ